MPAPELLPLLIHCCPAGQCRADQLCGIQRRTRWPGTAPAAAGAPSHSKLRPICVMVQLGIPRETWSRAQIAALTCPRCDACCRAYPAQASSSGPGQAQAWPAASWQPSWSALACCWSPHRWALQPLVWLMPPLNLHISCTPSAQDVVALSEVQMLPLEVLMPGLQTTCILIWKLTSSANAAVGILLERNTSVLHRASASLAVSGFIWQRIVKPAQRDWHFFWDVLAGDPLCF